MALFWKRFLRLTRGRISTLHAMEIIRDEESDTSLKQTISSVIKTIEQGSSLSEALAKHPSEFSPFVAELIKSAEKSGAWDEILQEIANGLEEGTF